MVARRHDQHILSRFGIEQILGALEEVLRHLDGIIGVCGGNASAGGQRQHTLGRIPLHELPRSVDVLGLGVDAQVIAVAALGVCAHAVDRRIGREGRLEVVRIVVAILDAAHHPRADGHRGLTGDEHALLGELLRHAVGVRWRGMIHVHHVVDQLNRRHVDRIVDVRGAVRMVERVAAERLHGEVVERVEQILLGIEEHAVDLAVPLAVGQLPGDLAELLKAPLGRHLDAGRIEHVLVDDDAVLVHLGGQRVGLAVDVVRQRHLAEDALDVKAVALDQLRQVKRHIAAGTLLQHGRGIGHVQIDIVARKQTGLQLQVAGVVVDEALVLRLDALVLEGLVEQIDARLRAGLRRHAAPHPQGDHVVR